MNLKSLSLTLLWPLSSQQTYKARERKRCCTCRTSLKTQPSRHPSEDRLKSTGSANILRSSHIRGMQNPLQENPWLRCSQVKSGVDGKATLDGPTVCLGAEEMYALLGVVMHRMEIVG